MITHDIVRTPPRPRGGLLNFPIHSKPVGLEIFKNQGGVDIAGWGLFFQGGVEKVLLFTNTKMLMRWLRVSIKSLIG